MRTVFSFRVFVVFVRLSAGAVSKAVSGLFGEPFFRPVPGTLQAVPECDYVQWTLPLPHTCPVLRYFFNLLTPFPLAVSCPLSVSFLSVSSSAHRRPREVK